MKTKSRNLLISFLVMIAMLFSVFAISPMTASAVSITPTPEETPAETVYVGGVALNAGQYVKNAETTAVTGEPAEDADGYAYYKADGTLLLASYSYEGDGYEYDSGMYAVIYSSGALSVELRGENVLKQTSEGKRGIFAVGNLDIDGVGSLSVSADWSIYSNGIITFEETLGKLDLTVTGTGRAIVSLYDSGSATDHDESIFVKGGDISATTHYGLDDLVITGGALTISSSDYALNMHPVINYDGEYTAVVSYNEDGSDSVAYDPAKLVTEIPNNYFRITPAPKTAIDSVSVSGIDLPEFGEAFNAEVDLDALTYGGEYKVADHWLEKYTGDEWVEYTGSDDLIEYGVRYRYVLSLMPNGGYSFSAEITDGDVKINDQAATVYKITEYPFYNAVEIAYEFSYEATYITSISVSGADLPEVGETADDMEFTPTSLTYGGAYQMTGISIEKYTGTNWVFYSSGSDDVIEAGVRYRLIITLMPTGTDAFAELLTSDDVTFNGKDAEFLGFVNAGTAKYAQIALEFSYEASSTTPITSISVSGADLPEVGETKDVMEFTPDSLTYGGEYKMVGRGFQKYTGTEWVDVSDTESLEYGVKYRVNLVLAPNEGYAFADSITSDDVTFNGEAGIFETLISGVGYASICYEFSYEEPASDYGITIADKDDSGATVGVLITEENYTDVLGDGTVSYDPTTNTLTLNGYKYEGEGFLIGSDSYYGICVTEFFDDLTVVLAGENVITLTELMPETYYTGIELWNGNMTIKGDGSLAISSPREGICVYGGEDGRGVLEIEGGNITIINANSDEAYRGIFADNSFKMTGGSLAVGATYGIDTYVFEMNGGSITVNAVADYSPCAICAYESFLMNGGTITASATGEEAYTIYLEGDFTMNGGSLKISSDYEGISCEEDSTLVISGGTLEISTKEAGYAFTRYVEDEYRPTVPTVTGDYSMTASVNEDGSGAVIYDEDAYETYKYVKIAFVTDYGITIADKDESGATVGVDITSENCTDVLGDGTVSYDPTTNTLTLNGYKYEGEGAEDDDIGYYGLMADLPADGLTIVLVGENSIKISGSNSAGMVFFGNSDLTIKGDGSLTINTGMQGIVMVESSGTMKINGGNIDITTTAIAVHTTDFVMTGGNLKITTNMFGFATLSADGAFCINGGSVEISTAYAGYAFIYADTGDETYNPIKPDLSGYVGAYKMTAGNNADGSDATDFNEVYLSSYKYVKITEIESYGITIADKDDSGATVGVLITEENCTDVLGDGTVSYNPTTNTLTLNGYKYEGSGFEYDGPNFGINIPDSIGTLNIVLKGENVIDVTNTDTLERIRRPSIGINTWETDVVFSGDGSLVISATDGGLSIFGEDAPSLEIKGGNITVNAFYPIETTYFKMSDGSLTVNATELDGDIASAIYSYEFKMTGGNLKITSAGLGVEMWHDSDEDAPPMISGGTFEISAAIAGGAFCYYNYDEDICVALAPDLTNYVGAYKLTAGANADGTGATDYNASDIATYKYAKLEPAHVHDYGTEWKSDANEHWNECSCGDKANKAAHTPGEDDGDCTTAITCTVCGTVTTEAKDAHTPGEDDGDCTTDIMCKYCDKVATEGAASHTGGTAACEEKAKCSVCGTEYGEALGHKDENKDHKCDRGCGKTDMGAHADSASDGDHVCDYGCGTVLEACSDANGDYACDVCSAQVGTPPTQTTTGTTVPTQTTTGTTVPTQTTTGTTVPTQTTTGTTVPTQTTTGTTVPTQTTTGTTVPTQTTMGTTVPTQTTTGTTVPTQTTTGTTTPTQTTGTTTTPDDPNNKPEDPSDDKEGLSGGAIAGIVIGSVAVAGIGGFSIFWFAIKKKTWADFLAILKKK